MAEGKFTPYIIGAIQEQQSEISNFKLQMTNEIQNSNDQISNLNLSLSGNAQTLAELETDINEQLNIISAQLGSEDSKQADLETKVADINNQLLSFTTFQSQIDEIKAQNETILSFLSVTDGKLDLMKGTLEAEGVVAGVFTVKAIDAETKTIGQAVIIPQENIIDADADGWDDATNSQNGEIVTVKTKALKENFRIFVTPETETPITWSVSERENGKSFTIKLSEPTAENIKFNWWLVEEK